MADVVRAKFSIADGRIEIEGSEAFVSAQLAKLEPLFSRVYQGPANQEQNPVQTPSGRTSPPPLMDRLNPA